METKTTTKQTPELYNAIIDSPGHCVIHKGTLRVIANLEYQRKKAVYY